MFSAEYVSTIRSRRTSKVKTSSPAPASKTSRGKHKKEEKTLPSDVGVVDQIKLGGSKTHRTRLFTLNYDEQTEVDDSQVPSLTDSEINLTAYYDNQDNLVELTINKTDAHLPKKLIHVLLVAAPFHHSLYKLTMQQIKLRTSVMSYLAKFIQQSYLTDLILDDVKLVNVDFYAIFEEITPLKHVSLARCDLGDDVIVGIAARLSFNTPACRSLIILNLTCNAIEDRGARALARMLRTNRQLCYLNLSGNCITDEGACAILNTLQEFPLTYEEYVSSRARRMEYCAQKHVIYKSCLEEILEQRPGKKVTPREGSPGLANSPSKYDKKTKTSPDIKLRKDDPKILADEMARSIMGEFVDPYDALNMVKKDKYRFCMGNKRLCNLNFSYNNLHFPTVVKLLQVLEWQKVWPQPPVTQQPTGLTRVALDGNPLPVECEELERIDKILLEKTLYGGDLTAYLRQESGVPKGKKAASARK